MLNADALTFVGAGLASLYENCLTFFADETYCEESGYKDRNID